MAMQVSSTITINSSAGLNFSRRDYERPKSLIPPIGPNIESGMGFFLSKNNNPLIFADDRQKAVTWPALGNVL